MVPGPADGDADGESSTARRELEATETGDELDEVDAELGEVEATGVWDGDMLSRADVDKNAGGADDLCATRHGDDAVTADESDTALVNDLLLAEERTEAKADELVFCWDRIRSHGGVGGRDTCGTDAGSVGWIGDTLGVMRDSSDVDGVDWSDEDIDTGFVDDDTSMEADTSVLLTGAGDTGGETTSALGERLDFPRWTWYLFGSGETPNSVKFLLNVNLESRLR